jgi:hypothetical protein
MEIWDEIAVEFNKEIDRLRISLGSGIAEDFTHYRQIVGSIHGIEWARDNLKDIVRKRLHMEDD